MAPRSHPRVQEARPALDRLSVPLKATGRGRQDRGCPRLDAKEAAVERLGTIHWGGKRMFYVR